jgi:hypothetical protein
VFKRLLLIGLLAGCTAPRPIDSLGNAQELHARTDNAVSCVARGGAPLLDFDMTPPVYVVCL